MTTTYTIDGAYMGDERSRVNVTDAVKKQITDEGLDVTAGSALLPAIQVEGEIFLTDQDLQTAKEQAEEACGGGSDAICNQIKTEEFKRRILEEKERQMVSSANIVKGRKMTINLTDNQGRKSVVEVPEGQKYKLSREELGIQPGESYFKVDEAIKETVFNVLTILAYMILAGVYAFSVLITYRAFLQTGILWQTILGTAIAVLFPFSGFFLVFGWFGLKELVKKLAEVKNNV